MTYDAPVEPPCMLSVTCGDSVTSPPDAYTWKLNAFVNEVVSGSVIVSPAVQMNTVLDALDENDWSVEIVEVVSREDDRPRSATTAAALGAVKMDFPIDVPPRLVSAVDESDAPVPPFRILRGPIRAPYELNPVPLQTTIPELLGSMINVGDPLIRSPPVVVIVTASDPSLLTPQNQPSPSVAASANCSVPEAAVQTRNCARYDWSRFVFDDRSLTVKFTRRRVV